MSAGFLNPGAGLGNAPADPVAELMARQQIAKLLAKGQDYSDASPKTHPMQVLAQTVQGALAGLDTRQQIAAQLAGQQAASSDFAKIAGTGSLGGSGSTGSPAARPASPGVQIPGKLGALDDNNLDLAVRTAMAEAGGMGAPGMRDVAAVLRNRALLSGRSVADEALAPNQFEPWNAGSKNDPRRFKVDSPEYQAALAAVRPILDGTDADPTGGATHFYAPKAQAALGRKAPSWDDGTGEDRGLHRFFRRPYAGKSPASLTEANPADLPAPNAKPVALNPMGDEDGGALPRTPEGFAIPPAPGQGSQDPAPVPAPSQARSDLAALFSGAPIGPAQSFAGTSGTIIDPEAADMPAPGAQPASMAPSPMQVPLPPARPSAADLQVSTPPSTPPSARQRLAEVIAQPRTDAPDPQSAPGAPPREGIAALLGGMQDGLDRVFGGAQTQARLDTQGGARQQIAQALAPPGPQYASLPPAGRAAPAAPGPAPARVAPQPTPPVEAGPATPPPAAPQPPVQVAQAGGMPPVASGTAQPQQAYSPRAQELMGFINKYGAYPAAKTQVETAQKMLEMELQPKTSQADLGDRIAILDAQGRQIGSMPKGAAPKGDDFGEIGRDAYDRPIYGYRNYGQKTVTQPKIDGPGAAAQAAPVDMNGKPIPAGVDPKQVRETQSKDYAASTVPVDPKQVAEVRKEVMDLPSYKNIRQAAPIYQAMLATADNDTKASDLNLIYGMGKIMDPGSVVREGEMALANGTSGLDERLIGLAKGVVGGARLGPDTRASLMREAHIRMKAYEEQFGFDSNHYRGIAGRMRANAEDIIPAYPEAKPYVSKAERDAAAKKGQAPAAEPAAAGADGYTVIDGVKIRRR